MRWIVKEWMISDSLWHHYWISINNVECRCIFPLDQRVQYARAKGMCVFVFGRVPDHHTSLEMRRWWLFLIRTLTGLWTSSEDVPDAWSLSPSEPIFTFSWTMPVKHKRAKTWDFFRDLCLRKSKTGRDRRCDMPLVQGRHVLPTRLKGCPLT